MDKIKIENVRLSFPSIFKKALFEEIEGKYEATFLIEKDDKQTLNLINKNIAELLQTAKIKLSPDKICLKDGDLSNYDGYENCFSLKASNLKRPVVINRDKTPIIEEDEIIYPGCYVNAIINFWFQNNKYGKRINSNLYGVQFLKDGEAFCKSGDDVSDDFEVLKTPTIHSNDIKYSEITFP